MYRFILDIIAVDKSEAGVADMDVQVITPSGRSLPLEVKSTQTNEIVEWQPEAPGQYKIEVNYGGEEVKLDLLTKNY